MVAGPRNQRQLTPGRSNGRGFCFGIVPASFAVWLGGRMANAREVQAAAEAGAVTWHAA